ncbi:MAG TPA: hypothetical protein VNS58_17640 [Puia sp.]|nr:hypothetical protein [Puia sp.]
MAALKKRIGKVFTHFGVKKKALGVYFFFFNGQKDLVAFYRKKVIPLTVRRRSANGIYAIVLDSDWLGLGARIVKTIEILLYCEERGLIPAIKYNYLEKGHGKADYFGELFCYKGPDAERVSAKAKYTSIRDIDELGWPEDYNRKLKLSFAKTLFDKYFSICPEILAEVDSFCKDRFGANRVLGVHYRGTDKAGEAPLVAKERLIDYIKEAIGEDLRFNALFVSTDDEVLLRFLKNSDLPVPVLFREDAVRSSDGDQFHRKKEISKSVINRDAIVNMLIMSRCSFLIKTASILSDCSVLFNPEIKVRVISFPHSDNLTWWPATEINASNRSLIPADAYGR